MIAAPTAQNSTANATFARVVGCGRHYRRDDQLGLFVAQRLVAHSHPLIQVTYTEAPGADLLVDMRGCGLLVVVDAVQQCSELPAGHWIRLDFGSPRGGRLAPPPFSGEPSHFMGVNSALALGGELGILPPNVWVYAIAGQDFGYGDTLSPGLACSVRRVSRRIHHDVAAWLRNVRRVRA